MTRKGIAMTAHSAGAYTNSTVHASLDALKGTGATWVMLMTTAYQQTADSTVIPMDAPIPSDASLESVISYAHSIGLKVMLKPHLECTSGDRALIGPQFTDAEWALWFASYAGFTLHYAALAKSTGCEMFCAGCELNSTVRREAEWRAVLGAIRCAYPGTLTYAANLYQDSPTNPMNVQWWDAVDFIGLNLYPKLSDKPHPTIADLMTGWKPVYTLLNALHICWAKPIILTEIGIRSIVGAARSPGDWKMAGATDLVGQQRWYEAALRTFAAHYFMAGLFWWEWAAWSTVGGPTDGSYTPHLKPAEATLRSWYSGKLS